jgi:tetratricopeptide (TPR) repeat protein
MNVAASVALAVAERVERTGGPRAGLVAWKALAANATDPDLRGRALLAALRCAVSLRDEDSLRELSQRWSAVERGVWDTPIAALCNQMIGARLLPLAAELSRAEARRHRTARALYLHARCLELSRAPDPVVAEAFRDAAARAGNEGAGDIELAARVRRLVTLARAWPTLSEALAEAGRIDLAAAAPEARVEVAGVLLLSPSRFVRAGAIDTIDAIALGAHDERLARRALMTVAGWADEAMDSLSPLEVDRLTALFSRDHARALAPTAQAVLAVLKGIRSAVVDDDVRAALGAGQALDPTIEPLVARAADVVRGRFEASREPGPPPTDPALTAAHRQGELLDAVVALRDDALARAARSLEALAEAGARGERLPRGVLTVAAAALTRDDAAVRAAAIRLIALKLRRPAAGAPRGGYLALADALTALGESELATTARRAAVLAREPGAVERLGVALTRAGWELADAGRRQEAIDKLREAKEMLGKT